MHRLQGLFLLLEFARQRLGSRLFFLQLGLYFGALRLHNSTQLRVDSDLVLHRTLSLVQKDLEGVMVPGSPTATPPVGTFSGQFQDTPTNSPTRRASRSSPKTQT